MMATSIDHAESRWHLDDAPFASVTKGLAEPRSCSLLLISWYFPPDNAIAAIRLGKMARFFEKAGHRVRVITPKAQSDDQSLALELDEQTVTRTSYFDLDRRFNPANRSLLGAGAPKASAPSLGQHLFQRARRLLGRLYRGIAFYPDKRMDWSFTLVPTLLRMIKRERPDVTQAVAKRISGLVVQDSYDIVGYRAPRVNLG